MPDLIDCCYLFARVWDGIAAHVRGFEEYGGWGVCVVPVVNPLEGTGKRFLGWKTVESGAHPDDEEIIAARNARPNEVIVQVDRRPQGPEFFVMNLDNPLPKDVHVVTWAMDCRGRWYELTRDIPSEVMQKCWTRRFVDLGVIPDTPTGA